MTRKNDTTRLRKKPVKLEEENDRVGKKKAKESPMSIYTLGVILSLIGAGIFLFLRMRAQESVKTPLNAPRVIKERSSSMPLAPHDAERFWGTYRSQLYFGMRTKYPTSPLFGLMWFDQFVGQGMPAVRHWCNQGDRLPRYGWLAHDGVNFGSQEIVDHRYIMMTDFVKRQGGSHGGDWTARFSLRPVPGQEKTVMSLLFYSVLQGQGKLTPEIVKNRLVAIHGSTEDLGSFTLRFPKSASNVKKTNFLTTYSPVVDQLKEVMMSRMLLENYEKGSKQSYIALGGHRMPPDFDGEPNFVVHQVTVSLPFEMEVVFESGSFKDRPNSLSGDTLTSELSKYHSHFDGKFENVFQLGKKNFGGHEVLLAKAALSNMVGGIGYWYGQSLVQSKYNEKPVEYWPAPLYSAVPSRSFFPRGFLWDEGFHNLLISKWDPEISKEIIGHWLDLMNQEGWIPREQILGDEARAKVPAEFVVQKNENANPPTLFLPLKLLIADLIKSEKAKDHDYLQAVFPRLKTWFNWFNVTQTGPIPFTYRWRGRDSETKRELNPKTLTSGLDDYPRASHPTDDEYHVDLRCWMAFAAGILADIAKSLGEPHEEYKATYDILTNNDLLDKLHWDPVTERYADYGLHSNKVKLEKPKPPKNIKQGQTPPSPQHLEKVRVTKVEPKNQFVDSFGYVSLFPFLLQIIEPTSPKLGKILTDLRNEKMLWTNHGLRSLAKIAPLYNKYNTEHDGPYWRGPIWININFLAVRALNYYSTNEGPYKDQARSIYVDLRKNLIDNVLKEYKRTGFIWEQYDDATGHGKGSHPFTGWSALVVAIMAEEY
ncbi:unnamed protein product [Owenia fusiformis]|uniref:Mannosyl-oligosaccharide glucosidase n=1 Tax=Owenia fusiformis TaxID=6347 RepID=A0A8J1T5R2_OWEFU|nr:unnamed protein product [Owenia fusiformis]